jgi:hypothetical protein
MSVASDMSVVILGIRSAMAGIARNALVDVKHGLWRILPNRIAATHIVPGSIRMVLLRVAGLDMRSASMRGGTLFTSRRVCIDRGVFINEGCFFEAKGLITIRSGTLLGPRVTILTSGHDVISGKPTAESYARPVTIGRDCWIGANVTICPGVTLADRVTVGAGAVVTKDLDAGVYGGVPAKRLGNREPIVEG